MDNPPKYTMNSIPLEEVKEEKDLGVTVDRTLTFAQHVAEKVSKSNRTLGMISRTFEYKDKETMLLLYKGLIRPQLEYANQVWAPQTVAQIEQIENVQRRFTKLIPGMKELNYEERLRKIELPSLSYRRLRGDMIEAYKILTNKYNIQDSPFRLSHLTHTRGHHLKLDKPRVATRKRQNSFFVRSVNHWNSLPEYVVASTSVKDFERNLDHAWSAHALKYTTRA